MEGRTKVTKEVLCEEARFILANVMAEARYSRHHSYEDIRKMCEAAVSIPFSEYVTFLEAAGYLRHDRGSETLEVTQPGEDIVNGGSLTELTQAAVNHFKNRSTRRSKGSGVSKRPKRDSYSGASQAPAGGSGYSASASSASSASSELVGGSRYEKLASIGTGGVGNVYRAKQVALEREVALKEMRELFGFFSEEQRPEIIRRFSSAVQAAANLTHPNILPIHDVNIEAEFPYLISELAPNGSARRLIKDAEEIPAGLAVKYLLQTLHALRAAHAKGVIHRGLKPENMLIDGYGNVKVSDFGFAKIVERDQAVIRQVYVGSGNVAYMAPELFQDSTAADAQSDIYALGIVFYELLTRKLPGRRSPMPSEINGRLPGGIDDIFDKMTRDARDERYSSVEAILDDVDKLDGLGDILDNQTQILVADNANPLDDIKFREGSADDAADGEASGAEEDVVSSAGDSSSRRPYSYQQRRKKL
ncbi:MAG: serine/threonine protein kinase [Deltaproteobacteria bacterium]|nr:serine/threonine protein kinase [Deltaproteobacteria bacterium]